MTTALTTNATTPIGTIAKITKRCPGCKTTKAVGQFGIANGRPDGRQVYCKPCARVKTRESAERKKQRDADAALLAAAGGQADPPADTEHDGDEPSAGRPA